MEKVITLDEPAAKKRGGNSSVDAMLEKKVAMGRLMEGYELPLTAAADAALNLKLMECSAIGRG